MEATLAEKTVRVRLNRTMNPIDGEKRLAGYETTMSATMAREWVRNGRVTILTNAPARPKADKPDPTSAPLPGSPAGSGAPSSSPRRGRPPRKPTAT